MGFSACSANALYVILSLYHTIIHFKTVGIESFCVINLEISCTYLQKSNLISVQFQVSPKVISILISRSTIHLVAFCCVACFSARPIRIRFTLSRNWQFGLSVGMRISAGDVNNYLVGLHRSVADTCSRKRQHTCPSLKESWVYVRFSKSMKLFASKNTV